MLNRARVTMSNLVFKSIWSEVRVCCT